MPVIAPAAIRAYFARPLDSWDYLKDVPKEELKAEAHSMGMRFATDSWHHQLVCWMIGATQDRFYFILKQGGGKSKISADIIRYRLRQGHIKHALIVAPEMIHVASWEEQLQTHAPDLTYQLLLGNKDERERMLKQSSDVYVINHRGLEVYMATRRTVKGKDDIERNKNMLTAKEASEFAAKFQLVILDEYHRLVNDTSLHYKILTWLAAGADFIYALSGTPHGKDPTPMFHQFKILDGGETLGRAITLFRVAFFTIKKGFFGGFKYTFKPGLTTALHRMIKHRSITYTTEELYDVPQCIPVRIPVRLRGEAAAYYQRIIQGLIEAQGDYSSLGNVFIRMRQCASGFLSLKADDDSRIQVEFADNAKLEALVQFVLSKPDEKILIYHEFIRSGELIEKAMTAAKVKWSSLRGGTKNPAAAYAMFLKDPKCQVFILNNRTGSESINPQYVSRRLIFYESPTDPKTREQAERRVFRPGQRYTSFIHDLYVKGTVEEKILGDVKNGLDFMSSVLSGNGLALLTKEQIDGYKPEAEGSRPQARLF
jgi:SNF2 family DNA or RNA helicase